MGERHGHRIRGVGGPGRALQAEQSLHHELDLLLGGAAGPYYGALDLGGRVLRNGQVPERGGEQDGSAGMAEDEGGADILAIEDTFDRHEIGAMSVEDFGDTLIDLFESAG